MHFKILMEGHPPWSNPEASKRGPGDLYGITFKVCESLFVQNTRMRNEGYRDGGPWGGGGRA